MIKKVTLVLLSALLLNSCVYKQNSSSNSNADNNQKITHLKQPDWVKNAVIYEINTRQFSTEGTFAKVIEALPRIKDLGVNIIWLMPIHEIGVKNRKEGLGSYYSVKDYRSINHEFGSQEDFKALVEKAHSLGLKVIIDWVPNHTAWDHAWITEHPEYYTKNAKGEITDPVDPVTGKSWGWTDVADLNYDNHDLWKAMNAEMAYWVTNFDIDGFRCDVAGEMPVEFWNFNNPRLNQIKPMFMLAEANRPDLYEAFNMEYGWDFMHLLYEINEGKKPISAVAEYQKAKNKEDLKMYFTANHDENTWSEAPMKFKENYHNYALLTYFMGGMPLIYNGQEALLDHPLAFFTKDQIKWEGMTDQDFFKKLVNLYKTNPAMYNGLNYGDWTAINSPEGTLVFELKKDTNELIVFQNYTNKEVSLDASAIANKKEVFGNIAATADGKILVAPNSSLVFK